MTIEDYDLYEKYITKSTVFPRFKIQMLHPEDESFSGDNIICDAINSSGTLNINLTSGIRRTMSIDFINSDGKYNPNPNTSNGIWITSKFALFLGLDCGGKEIYFPAGVFIVKDPKQISNFSDQRVTITGSDKYCLIDDSVCGSLSDDVEILEGTLFSDAVKMILNLAKDPKPPLIPQEFYNLRTPTDIRKQRGDKIDDLMKALAGWVSCYYFYDANGNFTITNANVEDKYKSSIWDYTTDQMEYLGSTVTINSSETYNQVTVYGGNVNGNVVTAIASNDDLNNEFNTEWMPIRVKTVKDSIIADIPTAQARAKMELKQLMINQRTANLSSTYFCHLDVDSIITLSDPHVRLSRYRFLIKSLQIPLTTGSKIQIGAVTSSEFNISVY